MTRTDQPGEAHAPTLTPPTKASGDQSGPIDAEEAVRVSTIVGDRLCIRCGFNLTGQPVMKESKYNLFIARCPECGAVASLQEYPILGKWANRWATLAAALWLLVLMAGAFGLGAAFFGFSMAGTELSGNSVSAAITDQWGKTAQGEAALEQLRQTSNFPPASLGRWSIIDADWWAVQNQWGVIADHGGVRRLAMSPVAGIWTAVLVIGFVGGVFGSVGLLHVRRLRLAFLMLLPIIFTIVFQLIAYQQSHLLAVWSLTANDAARRLVMPMIFLVTDIVGFSGLIFGAVVGRSIARGLVRAYLPPRMRSTMSFLWIAAGKTPPKP